ncbi:cell cycle control protein 50A [Acrasis kona]|uniref:Cell cycle control protein 50A n=1 Tax=Acrasis kona TaxID=1008807 RepID=A0AAW2ZBP3_9EUKA
MSNTPSNVATNPESKSIGSPKQEPTPVPSNKKRPWLWFKRRWRNILEQNLWGFQPIYDPVYMIALFYSMFLILLPIGIGMYFTSLRSFIVVAEQRYDDKCRQTPNNNTAPYCNTTFTITVPFDMNPPIYMYYKLYNFHQNHRLYTKSRYDRQLTGDATITVSDLSDCGNRLYYDDKLTTIDQVYMPCGVVAWSMFNDTFILSDVRNNVICNGPNPDGKNCTKSGISKAYNDLFKRGSLGRNYTTEYRNEPGHFLPDVIDEDFKVWMLTSPYPDPKKLYRIINVPMPAGVYVVFVEQKWPLASDVTKSIVLSTGNWLGGPNLIFSILNMAVGGSAFIVGTLFLFAFLTKYIVNTVRKE